MISRKRKIPPRSACKAYLEMISSRVKNPRAIPPTNPASTTRMKMVFLSDIGTTTSRHSDI